MPRSWPVRPSRLAVLWAIALAASPASGQEAASAWRKPHALKPGDTIAFVAPAGPVDVLLIKSFAEHMEQAGYKVRVPEGIGRRAGYLAGTDDQRADEMNAAIRDPQVRGIFAVRGGYGLTRILDRIDYPALRADPKVVTGYSDITALHLAIARKAKVISFHAPMPTRGLLKMDTPEHAFSVRSFHRAVFADAYPKGEVGYLSPLPADAPPARLVGGRARGRLIGGNLSLVASTLGTPFALEPEGAILFLEDVHEAPYRVDRMLSQLRLAGVFDRVAGVVLGSFTSDKPEEAADLERVLRDAFGAAKYPVIWRFPVGHDPLNATMPEGVLAEIDADAAALQFLENPVVLGP
ncbi:S66 peptidase family protein [Tundrisphaera sp. TA3]|uniref:S66 peptidase family protein n=1 Tax=Tundrisphaera sp. TA3 TaxID=3435775 RepID=UPI003EBE11CF